MIVALPYSSGFALAYDTIEGVDEWGEPFAISKKQTAIRLGVQYDVYLDVNLDEQDPVDIALFLAIGGAALASEEAYRRWVNGDTPLDGDMLAEPPLPL